MIPLTVYGSLTCEDTALAEDRLRALGIPYTARYRESDRGVDEILARWNRGNLVTPTLFVGDNPPPLAEPTLEQLEEALRAAGLVFQTPRAVELRGERKNQRLPNFTLPASDGR